MVALDTSCVVFPSAYFITEKARGQPLSTLALSREEKQLYLAQLGDALRRMHEVRLPGFGWLDEQAYRQQGEVRGSAPTWQRALCDPVPAGMAYLTEHAGIASAEADAIKGVVEAMRGRLAQYHDGRLLHGDLGALHVWVDPATQTLTSIIDFGDRLSGDPLWDFINYELGGCIGDLGGLQLQAAAARRSSGAHSMDTRCCAPSPGRTSCTRAA